MKNIPNNEIWYTTRNHGVLKSFDMYAFGSQLLSNTYEKGMGVLRFNTDLTVIGESAFSLCDELVTVELPDSITKIDVGAFSACENLKEFKVPDSVKEIGECAFGLCVNLEKFSGKFTSIDGLCLIVNGILNQFALGCGMEEYTIPNDVREIGWSAFSDSELTKINLHENIIKIGISAFCGCQNLTHINIPNSITTIADVAFQDCINLKNIFIPKTVTNLGSEIFEGCNNILVKYEDESIKISKDKGLKQLLEEYVALQKDVPNGWIYSGDKTAKIIHVPYGVTLVKSEAFEGCDNVEVIHLPQTIEEIEDGAFTDLDNLYRFESDYASPDGKCLIIKNTLVGFAAKDIEEYELPTGFAKVAPMVFYNKEQIKTIIIPEGVLSIGDEAFMGCLNLYHIKLPSSLNFIGYKTFADCISLRKIVVPNSVKVICGNNFQGCEHLEEVTLSDNLIAPNESLFGGCNNLKKLKCKFGSKDGRCCIINGVLTDYFGTRSISEYVIPNEVESIAKFAFRHDEHLQKIIIPASVTQIDDNAFFSCSKLKYVEFETITPPIFGENIFSQTALLAIYVPDEAISVYEKVFKKTKANACVVAKSKSNNWLKEVAFGDAYNNEISMEALWSIGVCCYKERKTKEAYAIFEKLIARGESDSYPYSILIEAYRNRQDIENEKRILTMALKNLPNRGNSHHEYQKRLNTLSAKTQEYKLPTIAEIPQISIKHGELYEEELFKLPEFNFYTEGSGLPISWYEREIVMQPIGDIIDYFKELIHEAELATSIKDYQKAAFIYEQIIAEKYWKPAPYDKLILIYSRAMLLDDEIRVLKLSIDYFTKLRAKRHQYIMALAEKYNALDYIEKKKKTTGRINYYYGWKGDICLYDSYPAIDKWIKRLEKKLKQ